jgi:hypothetical protein
MSSKDRYYADGVFISKTLPSITIRLPAEFAYVGQTAFILKQVAQVDRHHFLDGDTDGTVHRLVILHFESFLPTVDQTFNYRVPEPSRRTGPDAQFSPATVRLGAHEHIHNTWFFDAGANIRAQPEAELARTAQLLRRHGFALPGALQMSRYVRVVGADRKSELILFYMEPLAPTGLSAGDFVAGGRGAAAVERLSAALTARSGDVFMVEDG